MRTLLILSLLLLGTTAGAQEQAAPIAIDKLTVNYSMDYNSQQAPRNVYGSCVIRNTSDSSLETITLTVQMNDANGKEMPGALVSTRVDSLDPGQTYDYEWTWYNYTSIPVFRPEAVVVGKDADGRTYVAEKMSPELEDKNPLGY